MTTPQVEQVGQAVERLRRIEAGHSCTAVYGLDRDDPEDRASVGNSLELRDRSTLADFLLSIWPQGERPVPMEPGNFDVGDSAWTFADDGDVYCGAIVPTTEGHCVEYEQFGTVWDDCLYSSRDAANLAFHWRKFDELIAHFLNVSR